MRLNPRTRGVSLAICTHNGTSRLRQTLHYVLDQTQTETIAWELLVVNNASTDNTTEFVTQIWPSDKLHQLRIVHEAKLGVLHARQRAIREARYCYLSYIDDDNWISSNWVSEIYQIFETHPKVGLISCPSTAHLAAPPPNYFEGLKGWLAIGTCCPQEGLVQERPMSFWTAGLSLRLEAFDALIETDYSICLTGRTGNQTYGGEDHELCLSLTLMGWGIYYTHQISFQHEIPATRLNEAYLEKLILNGGKSRIILDIYRNEYQQNWFYNPYLAILPYGWQFWLSAVKYWLKRLFGLASTPLHPNRVGYLLAMGRLQSYWIHFRRIAQAQQNISILRSISSASQS